LAITAPTILQIIPELDTGGAELSTVEIAGAVAKAGGRALVLSQGGRMAEALRAAGGELVDFPAATKNPIKMVWNAGRIAKLARANGVQLIHARSRAPAWSAWRAARSAKLAFVTTYHGAYNENGKAKNLYNSIMARGDLVIANSHYTARLIRERYDTPDDRLRVIHRGVDGTSFDAAAIAQDRRKALRSKWGLPDGARVILHPARLTSWKGQETVIAAAGELERTGKLDAHFVFAGDAQGRTGFEALLMSQIAAMGLEDHVHIVGHVEDMPAAFAIADVAVVASVEPEAFGRTVTEAQAMGCPVIATDLGAPPETVLAAPRVGPSDATGWLVRPGDAQQLAGVLADALAMDPDARANMGARARAHVLANFSLDQMKRQTLAVYDELLGSQLLETFDAKNGS